MTDNGNRRFVGRRVVLGVSGSIAAFKAAELARLLITEGATVRAALTDGAKRFITPLTFQTLTGQPVYDEMFDQPRAWVMEHITWARWAEAIVVAPATAQMLAKLANGMADDPVSSLCLARTSNVPLLIAPSMNTQMWQAPATRRNVAQLRADGAVIIEPGSGELACGEVGPGRLSESAVILDALALVLGPRRELAGKKILVNAGPTREPLDAVRVLTNPSTGKMGFALAAAAAQRGAQATLVSGPTLLSTPAGVDRIDVVTAEEMWHEMEARWTGADAVIFAAAVSDFRPAERAEGKIKKGEASRSVSLEPTVDIAAEIGRLARERSEGRPFLVGFAAESEGAVESGRAKQSAKGLDLVVANEIGRPNTGFAADTDLATLIGPGGQDEPLGLMTKTALAERILDRVSEALVAH
jgi:phosphopantothenoylcysteine decarboxylase/phosphopantothenate--cysteine ligase